MTTAGSDPARPEIERRLEAFFARASHLSDAELLILRVVWDEQDETTRAIAWRKVKRVVRAKQRADLLENARSRLAEWVNNYLTATAMEYGNFLITRSGMDLGTLRLSALPPLLDAVAAIVATDGLDASEETALLEPFTRLAPHSQTD